MSSFVKNNTTRTPFGKNEYKRSTRGLGFESYTLADGTVPEQTIDGNTEKVIQPGTVMARITAAGVDQGKIGPYAPGETANESVLIEMTATGGTFTLSYEGGTTAAIAFNATAAAIEAALLLLPGLELGDIEVTGGPLPTDDVTIAAAGRLSGRNIGNITIGTGSLTGGSATATVTAGAATGTGAATDGRQDADNIVGVLDTFLPWQTKHRDVPVSVCYRGRLVAGWCFQLDDEDFIAMTDATKDRIVQNPDLAITFS